MNISKAFFFLFFGLSFTFSSLAQFTYYRNDSIKVSENGSLLKNPWAGGVNAAQINETDLNGDNKLDIVMFDRVGNRIMPFINNGNNNTISYKFAPEYISKFPKTLTQWMRFADFNCDGLDDIIAKNFLYSGAEVYLNTGTQGNYSFGNAINVSVKYPSTSTNIDIESVDIPDVADIDDDGDIDIFAMGNSEMFYFKNLSVEKTGKCGLDFEVRNFCWGGFSEGAFNSNIYLDSCSKINVNNPEGEGKLKDVNPNVDKHAGSTVAIFNFDNKHGMDVLLGDVSYNFLNRLMNSDSSTNATNSRMVSVDYHYPPNVGNKNEMFTFPAAFFADVNNDGLKDMIMTVNEPNNSLSSENVRLFMNTGSAGNPNFVFNTDAFLQEDMLDFGEGAFPVFFDYNNDGLMDIVVGSGSNMHDTIDQKGRLILLKNIGTASLPKFEVIDRNYATVDSYNLNSIATEATEGLAPTFGDMDGDGDQDMLIGDFNGNIHYFKNVATAGNLPDFQLEKYQYQDIDVGSHAKPQLVDLDRDGKLDLVIGKVTGRINYYRNLGTSANPIFNLAIDSIVHEGNFIFKYYLKGNPDLSRITLNRLYEISGTDIAANKGFLKITAVNAAQNYLSFKNYIIDSDTINEYSGNGFIHVAYDTLGGIQTVPSYNPGLNSNQSQPFFYDYQGEWQLISGTLNGDIMYYNDIDSNLYGKFNLRQDNVLDRLSGYGINVNGADINNDNKLDLVVGNASGGIEIFFGNGLVGINELLSSKTNNKFDISIYPNPSEGLFYLHFENFKEGESYTAEIYNLIGGKIMQQKISTNDSPLELNVPNGMYFIRLRSQSGEISNSKKIIIQ